MKKINNKCVCGNAIPIFNFKGYTKGVCCSNVKNKE